MNIIKLMSVLRKILGDLKIPEIPTFPNPLQENWCHPDIYLRLKKEKIEPCFTFQMFRRSDNFLSVEQVKTPDLIWLTNFNLKTNEFIKPIKQFLENFTRSIGLPDNCSYFNFQPDPKRTLATGETGCFWQIMFTGIECGKLSIYSSLPAITDLNTNSLILTLQLNKIIQIYTKTNSFEPINWEENMNVSGSFALLAWEQIEKQNLCAISDLKEILNLENAKTEDYKYKFCNILKCYNHCFKQINEDIDLYNSFVASLKKTSENLLDKANN